MYSDLVQEEIMDGGTKLDDEKQMPYGEAVLEVRKACRQFAMLYFHFSKVLVETLGEEKAKKIIQQAIFELSVDRSEQLKQRAEELGLPLTMETFQKISDLPKIGWDKKLGKDHCPYAVEWMRHFQDYPWFKQIAPLYCDVIDTTNAEVFTGCMSHKITENVLKGGETCRRRYFLSEKVKHGEYTYGVRK